MAWIEERSGQGGTSYRVVWRQKGLDGKQQQTFPDRYSAERLKTLVDHYGNRWPPAAVYVRDRGFADEIESDSPLFADYAEKTIRARRKADERTKADYLGMLKNHITPVIGNKRLDEIDRFDVVAVAERAAKAGKSAKTIANVHGLLSSILDDAVGDDLVGKNVARGEMPSVPDVRDEEMCFLTHAEAAHLLEQIPAGPYRDLARLLFGTGLRWSEATALQVHDIDLLGRRTLTVRRAWKRRDGLFVLGEPKSAKSRRTLSLSAELVSLLTPYVAQLDPSAFLFTTPQGRPVRHSNYYNRVWLPAIDRARRCEAHKTKEEPCGCAGTLTKKPRIHDARHTHASWLLDAKVTLPAIQRRLGHESIQTTIDRYSHLMPAATDEIDAAVDRALRGMNELV